MGDDSHEEEIRESERWAMEPEPTTSPLPAPRTTRTPANLQQRTGVSIKKLVQTLRALREVTITLAGQTLSAQPPIPADVQELIDRVTY